MHQNKALLFLKLKKKKSDFIGIVCYDHLFFKRSKIKNIAIKFNKKKQITM